MDGEQWRGLFSMAQDYKNSQSGIFEELQQGGTRYTDPIFIADGGMKEIYSVHDNTTGRRVALALLKDESSQHNKELFLRESRITAFLQHPNIMPVYDMGIDDGNTPYFTMKLSRGESLHQIIKRLRANDSEYRRTYTLPHLIQIFRKVCDAVASAHSKGVIHLDLKPDNIQISNYGEVLVCDWGLSKITNSDVDAEESLSDMDALDLSDIRSVTRHDHVKGTPGFMAPEQANPRKGKRDERTDIFSVGAVLYTLLTYEIAIRGRNTQDIIRRTARGKVIPPRQRAKARDIPGSLEAVCMKAMARRPEDRYQYIEDIIDDIDSWQNGFATEAEEAGLMKQVILIYKRNKLFFNTLIAFFAVIFGILSTFLFIQQDLVSKISEKEKTAQAALASMQKEKEEKESLLLDRQVRNMEMAMVEKDYKRVKDALAVILEIAPDHIAANKINAEVGLIDLNFKDFAKSVKKAENRELNNLHGKLRNHIYKYLEDPSRRNQTVVELCEEVAESDLDTAQMMMASYLKTLRLNAQRIAFFNELLKRTNVIEGDFSISYEKEEEGPFLNLSQNPQIEDIYYLRFFKLHKLDISYTAVSDLTYIRDCGVNTLNISHTQVEDLQPLKQTSVSELYMDNTTIRTLTPLKDVPLIHISLLNTNVSSLSTLNQIKTLETVSLKRSDYKTSNLRKLEKKLKY